jgi:hypothetical protein
MNYLLEPFYGGNSVFLCGAVCVLLVIILLAVISFSNKAWNAKSFDFDLDTYSIGVTSWVVELVQQSEEEDLGVSKLYVIRAR